jgi:HEAT repeat protein
LGHVRAGRSDATDPATTEALAARADDPHDDTRAEAILGLARLRDPRARALIERELSKPVHGSLIEVALAELDA